MINEVYVAVERSDGSVAHAAVQLYTRLTGAPSPEAGDQLRRRGWYQDGAGGWRRDDSDSVIDGEIRRFESELWMRLDGVSVVSWKRLSQEEHEVFGKNRHHRDALEMVGGEIRHNMPKARELHKHLLRHQRGEKLLVLDGASIGAQVKGDSKLVADLEDKRQELRDLTDDPRIEAAQTIEELVSIGFVDDAEASLEELRTEIASLGRRG